MHTGQLQTASLITDSTDAEAASALPDGLGAKDVSECGHTMGAQCRAEGSLDAILPWSPCWNVSAYCPVIPGQPCTGGRAGAGRVGGHPIHLIYTGVPRICSKLSAASSEC